MDMNMAPQYPGSQRVKEKKEVAVVFGGGALLVLLCFCLIEVMGRGFIQTVIVAAIIIAGLVAINAIDKAVKESYRRKLVVWCDYWVAFDEKLNGLESKLRWEKDEYEKLKLETEIEKMVQYREKWYISI